MKKIIYLASIFALLLSSCERDLYEEPLATSKSEKKITYVPIEKVPFLMPSIIAYNKNYTGFQRTSENSNGKYENLDLDLDKILMLEKNGDTTYSIRIKKEFLSSEDKYFDNLNILKLQNEEYKSFIMRYNSLDDLKEFDIKSFTGRVEKLDILYNPEIIIDLENGVNKCQKYVIGGCWHVWIWGNGEIDVWNDCESGSSGSGSGGGNGGPSGGGPSGGGPSGGGPSGPSGPSGPGGGGSPTGPGDPTSGNPPVNTTPIITDDGEIQTFEILPNSPNISKKKECGKIVKLIQIKVPTLSTELQTLSTTTSLNTEVGKYSLSNNSSSVLNCSSNADGYIELPLPPVGVKLLYFAHTHNSPANSTFSIFSWNDVENISLALRRGYIDDDFVCFLSTADGTNYAFTINNSIKFLQFFANFDNADFDPYFVQKRLEANNKYFGTYDSTIKNPIFKVNSTDLVADEKAFLDMITDFDMGITLFEANSTFTNFEIAKHNLTTNDIDKTPCN